ncbi:MAG: hypothetical protein WCT05_04880 [Lentisphaeria bacterium]
MKTRIPIFSVCFFALLGTMFALSAQETPAEATGQVTFSADGVSATMNDFRSENLWMQSRQKASDTWRFFMHGFRDHKATPIVWQQLFKDAKEAETWIDPSQTLKNTVKKSTFPVLLMDGKKALVFPKPLLDISALAGLKGQTLRFFVWIKGENCGQEKSLWDGAPALTLSLKDSLNNLLSTEGSLFKTRGTFPWFCYYLQIDIPVLLNTTVIETKVEESTENLQLDLMVAMLDPSLTAIPQLPDGGGLFLTLSNPGGGKAYFSTLSWEIADKSNSLPKSDWADPLSGSRAPNPDYDELPMHLFFGLDRKKHWNFLQGNQNSPDVTSIKGLEQYLKKAAKDWFHMQYGVAFLPYLQTTGTTLEQSGSFETGWRELLGDRLVALQNPETGLWGADGMESLLVTQAIVSKCFSPKTLPRSDLAQEETPWLSVTPNGVPNAGNLLNSLLHSRMKDNVTGKIKGWNRFAFQPEYLGAGQRDKICDLGATSAAVRLLAQIAAQTIISSEKELAQRAIREAWEYSLENFITPEYLWKQNDFSLTVSSSAYMFQLLEATPWLEPRILSSLAASETEASEIPGGKIRVRWKDKKNQFVALRVYAVPETVPVEKLSEEHLIAILNRNTRNPLTADPLFALQTLAATSKKRWGITPESEGAVYLAAKLAKIPQKLIYADGGSEIIFPMPTPGETQDQVPLKYYLTTVTSYGEMTPFQKILEP